MRIFFEDKDLMVVFKEAGLAVENADISKPDLVSEIKKYLGTGYLGVVHRLDMPVEGLLVFAKNKTAASGLSKELLNGGLNKNYLALVCGKVSPEKGKLVDYLSEEKTSPKGGKRAVISASDNPKAKKAILSYTLLGSRDVDDTTVSLLDVSIETGRFHQIRAQLSNMGHPIVADKKYGNCESDKTAAALGIRNVALFANRISFIHPVSKERMRYEYIPENTVIKELLG